MTRTIDLRLEITETQKTLYALEKDGTASVLASVSLEATRGGGEEMWLSLMAAAIEAQATESYGGTA